MRVEFSGHGQPASVDVDVHAVRDPQALGCDEDNLGLPGAQWTAHLPYLQTTYPPWQFDPPPAWE